MGLAQHIYRRGGVYWWRRRIGHEGKGRGPYLYLSLKVRTPKAARLLGLRVSAEADRIAVPVAGGRISVTIGAFFTPD